jgi:hypothetical protein
VARLRPSATLEEEQTPRAVRARLARVPEPSCLRDFVYGGIDGAVTTFAVVAGVAGADLGANVVIIVGRGQSSTTSSSLARSSTRLRGAPC